MTSPARGGARAAAAAVVLLLLVSACAAIPSAGPVTRVADDKGLGESTVRYSPGPPVRGATPERVVRGFLDAMLAYPTSSATAEAFLTPDAAKRWSPGNSVTVYSYPVVSGPVTAVGADKDPDSGAVSTTRVRLDFTEDARLDRQGHYTRMADSSRQTFALTRVDGEWRISNPQDGIMVNRKFFSDYFRQFNLFFFDRPGRRIAPDPVYLVVGERLATGLVTSLAEGPRTPDGGASRSYVPPLASLRPSVPVSDDGVADVEFTEDFSELSDTARNHLSAQIVWTLRQVPGIDDVQVVGGTTPLSVNGDEVQPTGSWGIYGPSQARGNAYGIVDDKVVQVDRGDVEPLRGAWGRDARGAVSVAVSGDGIAGVLPGRGAVRVTDVEGGSAETVPGSRFIAPQWDPDGTVWLVDDGAGGTRVRLLADRQVRTLPSGPLAALDVRDFSLSPDTTRYAVTVVRGGTRSLFVGAVERDADDDVTGLGDPVPVHTSASAPRSASWSSGTELSFLAESESGVQVYRAAIDGSATTGGGAGAEAVLPDVDSKVLAVGTGPSPDLYATDARGRLWFLPPDGSWRLVKTRAFTALTYGR